MDLRANGYDEEHIDEYVCDSGEVERRCDRVAVKICLIGRPGALDGPTLEEYDKEAGNRPGDDDGEGRKGEKPHPLVYENPEVEEAHASFAGRHCEGVDEVYAPEYRHQVGEIILGYVVDVISVAILGRADA